MRVGEDKEKFEYTYGPVPSWRLGSSLGVDIISKEGKICSFDCLYCQIGATQIKTAERKIYVPTEKVLGEIRRLPPDLAIDYITFSGNGEPTLALNLGEAIRGIKDLRKEKITVITNSSFMHDKSVRNDLSRADFVMAKLDAYDEDSFQRINRPAGGLTFDSVYAGIKAFGKEGNAKLALQIMFFKENKNAFKKLAGLAFQAGPHEIQINTPLRQCPVKPLSKNDIAGIKDYFLKYGGEIKSKTKVISVYDAKQKKVKAMDKKETLKRRGKLV